MLRKLKSNDLGKFLEDSVVDVCTQRECTHFRIHTIRSFKGVSNPCDFLVLEKKYTALLECKSTADEHFSCADFTQLTHFEKAARFKHVAVYGLLIYFYCDNPVFVFANDKKVIENKSMRRPIRASDPDSFNYMSTDLGELLDALQLVK